MYDILGQLFWLFVAVAVFAGIQARRYSRARGRIEREYATASSGAAEGVVLLAAVCVLFRYRILAGELEASCQVTALLFLLLWQFGAFSRKRPTGQETPAREND